MSGFEEKYEAVIGLEVHVELKTGRKIFCSCSPRFGDEPNTKVCPICLGMPGTLPRFSDEAAALAVRAGLAFGCKINRKSWFDRKNYYYPDLPKGYQITQASRPICVGGAVPIETSRGARRIELTRIHMEEDAGKLIHRGGETLIDYNRAGVPLIEIVSEPQLRTPEEAKAYLNALRRTLRYIGVSDCKMNEGSLRCDVNISVRRRGEGDLGVKCEIKNVNSVNYVGRALEEEIIRQTSLLERGEAVEAETRRFNEDTGHTEKMRKKEAQVDYRYFTEPNLPVMVLTDEWFDAVRHAMPPLPDDAAKELVEKYGVRGENAALLTDSPELTEYFTRCIEATPYRAQGENLFMSELWEKAAEGEELLSPQAFGEICAFFGEGRLVSTNARRLIRLTAESGEEPRLIAEREKLFKLSAAETSPYVERAIASCEKAAADFRRGKRTAARQILGAVMRLSEGRADPIEAEALLIERLEQLGQSEQSEGPDHPERPGQA